MTVLLAMSDLSFLLAKCYLDKNQTEKKNLYYSCLAGFSYRGTNWAHETDTRSNSGKMFFQFLDTVNSVLMGEEIKVQH